MATAQGGITPAQGFTQQPLKAVYADPQQPLTVASTVDADVVYENNHCYMRNEATGDWFHCSSIGLLRRPETWVFDSTFEQHYVPHALPRIGCAEE